jgi:hypothetical protein
MVGLVERDKALWMPCSLENTAGFIDRNYRIQRRMKDE